MIANNQHVIADQDHVIVNKGLYKVYADGTLKLSLHPGQQRAWDSARRFIFMIAGTQGGKTSFGPFWLYREIMRCGPGDYLAVTASYDLFKLKMLPEIRYVFETLLGVARFHSGERVLEMKDPVTGEFWATRSTDPMWGRIILRSAVAKGGLESSSAKAAWLDECGMDEFSLGVWEAVRRRLSLQRGRALGTTTPYNLGWLKKEMYDPWIRGDEAIDIIQFTSITNPAFPIEEYKDVSKRMPDWKFRMMYGGLFTKPAGMIFEDFIDLSRDEGGHRIAPFNMPIWWKRYVGGDPGALNFGLVWLAEDPDTGFFYLYRARKSGRKPIRVHAEEAMDLAMRFKENVVLWAIGNRGEKQVRYDWEDAGASPAVAPPFADVEIGIDRIVELLRLQKLFIFDTAEDFLDEIRTYSRKLTSAGDMTEQIKDKSEFHLIDALRYVVAQLTSEDLEVSFVQGKAQW